MHFSYQQDAPLVHRPTVTSSICWPAPHDGLSYFGHRPVSDNDLISSGHWPTQADLSGSGHLVEEIYDGGSHFESSTFNEDSAQLLEQCMESMPISRHDETSMQVVKRHIDFRRNHLWPLALELNTVREQHFEVILPKLRALLPSTRYRQEIHIPELSVDDTPFSQAYLRLLVVSLANGFAGYEGFPVADMLTYLQSRFDGNPLLNFLESMDKHGAASFARGLLLCAVQAGQHKIVDFLLSQAQFMLDVNCYATFEDGERYRLINHAIRRWDVAVTKVLLKHRAIVRLDYYNCYNHPLLVLIESHPTYYEIRDEAHFFRIGELLLQAGADATVEVLRNALNSKFSTMLCKFCELVIDKHVNSQHQDWLSLGIVRDLIYRLDSETSFRIVKILIEAGARFSRDVDTPSRRAIWMEFLSEFPTTTIDAAAKTGNLTLLRLLQEYGAECTTFTLVCAIQSDDTDLVHVLCNEGVSSVSADELGQYQRSLVVEMARGIHESGPEMRSLLQRNRNIAQGYHNHLRYALLLDAVRAGDVEQVKELLKPQAFVGMAVVDCLSNVCIDDDILQIALDKALTLQYDDIALVLFETGANVGHSFEGIQIAFERSLRHKNKCLAKRLMMAAYQRVEPLIEYLPLAVDWGETEIALELVHTSMHIHRSLRSEQNVRWLTVQSVARALGCAAKAEDKAMMAIVSNAVNHGSQGSLDFPWPPVLAVDKGDQAMTHLLLALGSNQHFSWSILEVIDHNIVRLFDLVRETDKRCLTRGKKLKDIVLQYLIYRADMRRLTHFLELLENSGHLHSLPGELDYRAFQLEFDTPLATAINAPKPLRFEAIAILLEHEFDPNGIIISSIPSNSSRNIFSTRTERMTPLLQAIMNNDPKMVEMLIKAGANINCATNKNIPFTPLQQATKQGNFEITQLLLQKGADPDSAPRTRSTDGTTALQLAAVGGYVGILELLLDKGANVEAPGSTKNGTTVLGAAAKHGRLHAVRLLLQRGVRLKRQLFGDDYLETRIAKHHGHYAIADLLESYQNRPSAQEFGSVLHCEWQPRESTLVLRNSATDAPPTTSASAENVNGLPASSHACSQCKEELSNASSLKRHIRCRHSDCSSFACNTCPGKTFKRKDLLRRHILTTHSNTGKVPCSNCGKFFRRDYYHSMHLTADGQCKDRKANRARGS